jgi:hypothetical protein
MITLYVVSILITAVIANDSARAWVLATIFGDCQPESIGAITPEDMDVEYQDDTYQVYYDGYSVITRLSGAQARNLIAFGHTLAYCS